MRSRLWCKWCELFLFHIKRWCLMCDSYFPPPQTVLTLFSVWEKLHLKVSIYIFAHLVCKTRWQSNLVKLEVTSNQSRSYQSYNLMALTLAADDPDLYHPQLSLADLAGTSGVRQRWDPPRCPSPIWPPAKGCHDRQQTHKVSNECVCVSLTLFKVQKNQQC